MVGQFLLICHHTSVLNCSSLLASYMCWKMVNLLIFISSYTFKCSHTCTLHNGHTNKQCKTATPTGLHNAHVCTGDTMRSHLPKESETLHLCPAVTDRLLYSWNRACPYCKPKIHNALVFPPNVNSVKVSVYLRCDSQIQGHSTHFKSIQTSKGKRQNVGSNISQYIHWISEV